MRDGHSRYSPHCAEFAAGFRIHRLPRGESREISWRDVDFDAGEIVVRGDATTGTKNWELRRVPLIPDARALFERMRGERHGEPLDAKVFRVSECQKALDRACKKVGTDRIAITICGIYLQRGASNRAWTFPRFLAGSDTKTAARWR